MTFQGCPYLQKLCGKKLSGFGCAFGQTVSVSVSILHELLAAALF